MGKTTFLQDFKAFAMKGNVIDMAVGVIIGGAFGKIVSSVVADVIMPPIGLLVGGVNFTDLKLVLKQLRQFPPGDVRLPHHRLLRLPLRAPAVRAEPQEAPEACHARRSPCAEQGGTAPDGNPRLAEGAEIIAPRFAELCPAFCGTLARAWRRISQSLRGDNNHH